MGEALGTLWGEVIFLFVNEVRKLGRKIPGFLTKLIEVIL